MNVFLNVFQCSLLLLLLLCLEDQPHKYSNVCMTSNFTVCLTVLSVCLFFSLLLTYISQIRISISKYACLSLSLAGIKIYFPKPYFNFKVGLSVCLFVCMHVSLILKYISQSSNSISR